MTVAERINALQAVLDRLEVGDLVRVQITREGTVTDTDPGAGTFTIELPTDQMGGDGDPLWRFQVEESGQARVGIIAKAQSWQLGDVVLWRGRVYQLVEEPTVTGTVEEVWQRVGQARKFQADFIPADAELLVRDGAPQAPQRDNTTRRDSTGIAPGGMRAVRTSTVDEAAAVSEAQPITPLERPDGPLTVDAAELMAEAMADTAVNGATVE